MQLHRLPAHQHAAARHHHHHHRHHHLRPRPPPPPPPPPPFSPAAAAAAAAVHGDIYTPQDEAAAAEGVYVPPVEDISSLLAGLPPTAEQIARVRRSLPATGFLALTGSGVDEPLLRELFAAARAFFAEPLDVKERHVVRGMTAGRGYEISPEHRAPGAMAALAQQQRQAAAMAAAAAAALEPSAAQGVLSERFLCGPPLLDAAARDADAGYYRSELGEALFAPDSWPTTTTATPGGLRATMTATYSRMAAAADAALALLACALGERHGHFVPSTRRPMSNMQVANYCGLLAPPPPGSPMRKRPHIDSGTVTLLASEDWLVGGGAAAAAATAPAAAAAGGEAAGGGGANRGGNGGTTTTTSAAAWQPGDGGLQLLSRDGRWLEVAVPPGALLLNLGGLAARYSNGLLPATLHRVTNPTFRRGGPAPQRLSVAFFAKPDADAVVAPLPGTYGPTAATARALLAAAGHAGEEPPSRGVFVGSPAGELTRQGLLLKLRHLPPEEASRRYHEAMAATRSSFGRGDGGGDATGV